MSSSLKADTTKESQDIIKNKKAAHVQITNQKAQ